MFMKDRLRLRFWSIRLVDCFLSQIISYNFWILNDIQMKTKWIVLLSLLILTTSCDRTFRVTGKVVDETSGRPVTNVKITTSEKMVIYSDSIGDFTIDRCGPGSMGDKLELLIEKDGYETSYFDLSNVSDLQNVNLEIRASNIIQPTFCSKSLVRTFYFINLYIVSLLSLITILFIAFKRIKHKWIWLVVILFICITFKINYVTGVLDVDFLHSPFYLKHYDFYPFTIKIVLPIAQFLFWVLYFVKRDLIVDSDNES